MPRDYKFRSQAGRPQRAARPGMPSWMAMLAGLGMGLTVAVGAYVEGRYPGTFLAADEIPDPRTDLTELTAAPPAPAARPKPKPRFEFYTLLPAMEVEVANSEPAPRRKPPTHADKAEPARPAQDQAGGAPVVAAARDRETASTRTADVQGYMLQVGSFSQLADADRLRANLTLNGHDALIQTVSVNGIPRHRVRLGPFGDRKSLERAQANLAAQHVQSMVMRIRG